MRTSQTRKPKTLITMRISQSQLERLKTRCDAIQVGWGLTQRRLDENELIDAINDVEILMVGYEQVTARVIQEASKLKLIAVARGNPVNVDIQAAAVRSIPVIHAPGRNAIAAAEYTMGLILSLVRNITKSDRSLRSGKFLGEASTSFIGADQSQDVIWNIDGDNPYINFCGFELNGKILGLIGFGFVAHQVARLAKAFGMHVLAYSPNSDPLKAAEENVKLVDLTTLLSTADIISVHCKATADARGMIDRDALNLMKPSSYLINTARAIIIDQDALVWALENNMIAGAALDVYWFEPLPSNHPLLKMDNVIITPHLAGAAEDVRERHSRMIVDDVFAWLDGKVPGHLFQEK